MSTQKLYLVYLLPIIWSITLASHRLQSTQSDNTYLPKSLKNLPCPNAEDIQPCLCHANEDYRMVMDCSYVSSEAELAQSFKTNFPFTNFHKLEIRDNRQLTKLEGDVFGNATFQEVYITNTTIELIREDVLKKSFSFLASLHLDGNRFFTYSLGDLASYQKVTYLSVQSGALQMFPTLKSPSLRSLILDGTQLGPIEPAKIQSLKALEMISLQHCTIMQISSGTFANNTKLQAVHLGSNNLTTLPHNAVALKGSYSQLSLFNNQISNLPSDSFSGVKMFMDMKQNSLTEFTQELWRPLLENKVYTALENNPFKCGCDIAWLILDRDLLARVSDKPTCSSGEAFVDLDPAMYEQLC